jgi:hypothetical protein
MVGRSSEKCTSALHKIEAGVQKSAKRRHAADAGMQAAFLEAALANIDFKTNVFDVSFLP